MDTIIDGIVETDGGIDDTSLGSGEEEGSKLGWREGWEDFGGPKLGEKLGRIDTEGSFELAGLGLEDGGALEVVEGLRLGRTEGIGVSGGLEGVPELRGVGAGEGFTVLGAVVTLFLLRYHLGLRLHRSAFFLSFPFFFFRSSVRFFLHFFRILFRRPGG